MNPDHCAALVVVAIPMLLLFVVLVLAWVTK